MLFWSSVSHLNEMSKRFCVGGVLVGKRETRHHSCEMWIAQQSYLANVFSDGSTIFFLKPILKRRAQMYVQSDQEELLQHKHLNVLRQIVPDTAGQNIESLRQSQSWNNKAGADLLASSLVQILCDNRVLIQWSWIILDIAAILLQIEKENHFSLPSF